MIDEDFKVVRLNVGVFGRASEKVVGMLHDELIERSRRRDKDCAGTSSAPPRAACPLPRGGSRSWIAGHHARVERTNINSQFEGVCSHNSEDATVAQTTFNLAPFPRKIPSAVTANRFRLAGLRRIRLLQVRQQNFGVQSAVGEHNRLQLAGKNLFHHSCCFIDIAAPNPEISVDHWRVVEHEKLLARGCSVLFDYFDILLDELSS